MAVPTFVSAGALLRSGTGTVTPDIPSGTADGDVLLLLVETGGGTATTISGGNQTWTEITGSPLTADSGTLDNRLSAFWARRGASTPTAPTTNDSGDHQSAVMAAFRGCKPTDAPWVDTPVGNSVTSAGHATHTASALTTTVADTLVVVLASCADNVGDTSSFSNSNLSGVAVHFTNDHIAGGHDGTVLIASGGKAAAGSIGTSTVTWDSATPASNVLLVPLTSSVPATTNVSVFNGTTWDLGTVNVYNGATWDQGIAKVYNGSAWEPA